MKIYRCLASLIFVIVTWSLALQAQEVNDDDPQQAIQSLKKAISLNESNDAAYFELARIQLEMGASGDAAINAKKATQLKPNNEWYWLLLSDVYKQMEDFTSLPPIYAKLISLKPEQKEFYFDKAYSEFLSKDYDASLKSYAVIEKKFGPSDNVMLARHNVYIAQGNSHIAVEELHKFIKDRPKDNKGYILLSNFYLKLGDTKQAMKTLDKAEKKIPNDPYIAVSRSDVYNADNEGNKAIDNLKKIFSNDNLDVESKVNILSRVMNNPNMKVQQFSSIEELANILTTKYPNSANAFAIYGDVLIQTNKQELARLQYIRSTELDPKQHRIWEQLLQLELAKFQIKDAAAHAEKAAALFPDNPITQFFAGHAFSMNKDFKKARESFEAALNNADERNTKLMAQIYSSLGDTYNALQLYKESDLAYDESLELEPNNAGVLNNYAYYLSLRKQDLDKAAEMSRRSNVLEPDNGTFEDTFAWVLFQQEKYQEALIWIEKAISSSENVSATLLEHYGDILSKLGREKEALQQWRSALKLAEGNAQNDQLLRKKIDLQAYVE